MPIPNPKLLGIVLCGGASKRMGRDKAELTMPDGRSFLDHACRRLEKICDTVCVSSSRRRNTDHEQIADPPDSHGPITGIFASLTFARDQGFNACVFTPVDTPSLTTSDLETMIAMFADHQDQIVCAASNHTAENVEPLIAIYPVALTDVIADWIDQGRYSPRRLIETLPVITVPLSAESCRNINTPSDLDLQSPKP